MILSHSFLVLCPFELTHIKGVCFPRCLHSTVQKISVSQKLEASVSLLISVLIDFGWLGLDLFGLFWLKVFIKCTKTDQKMISYQL